MKTLIKTLILLIIINTVVYSYGQISQVVVNNPCMSSALTAPNRLQWVTDHKDAITTYLKSYLGANNYIRSWQYVSTSDSWCVMVTVEYFYAGTPENACTFIKNNYKDPYFHTNGASTFSEIPPIQITGCLGYDTNIVIINSVKCYELGLENPLKPKNLGAPTNNGKWVYLVYNVTSRRGTYDSTAKLVVSGGCSGISNDGTPLKPYNAKDTCVQDTFDMVPRTMCSCMYNGSLLSGKCSDNGIDTSCGGQTPFQYTSNNDSIINPCKFDGNNIDTGTNNTKRVTDSLHNTDTTASGNDFAKGINKLSDDIRSEHALDRSIMDDQLRQQRQSNSLLQSLVDITRGISNKITDGFNSLFGKLDSNYVGSGDTIAFENGGKVDTSNTIGDYDTATVLNKLRNDAGDTTQLLHKNDSLDSVVTVFNQFKLDIYDGDCDCNSEWFAYNLTAPFNVPFKIDICPYNVSVITKPLFKLTAIYLLFIFYRKFLFKIMSDVFK